MARIQQARYKKSRCSCVDLLTYLEKALAYACQRFRPLLYAMCV